MLIRQSLDHIRFLKNSGKMGRLAVEITIILIIKIILIWLLWYFCFSHPVKKPDRQEAVTRIILNNSSE
ncbi:MAG: cytochrome oxidase putative small subunit CydP [Methylophilaceae bacterium]